jgi:uncharacterized protein (DUF1499 family)
MRWLRLFLLLVAVLAVLLVGAGQAGFLAGHPPQNTLGVRDGRLAPPSSTLNSVSSQADVYPGHPQREYARIAPLRYSGDGMAAMGRLAAVLHGMDRIRIVVEQPDYIRAEIESRWLRYVDDAEFWLDPSAGVIQVRSASRLGRSDLGANRAHIEAIRARLAATGQ